MSHHDASDPDDRKPDQGRPRRTARPAWDAATYGVPEDSRRSRSRGRPADPYPPEPDPYAYQSDPYPAPPPAYSPEPYPPDPYPAAEPYPAADTYAAPESYRGGDSYRGGEARPLDGYPQAPSYRPEPYRYEAPAHDAPAYPPPAYDPPAHDPPAFDPPSYEPTGAFDRGRDESYGEDRYPGGRGDDEPPAEPAPAGRAGRNLPAAIGVGVLLAAVALSALFLWRPAFFGVIAVAVGVGVWELVRAIRTNGVNPPMIPLIAGGALMTGLAWRGQADGLTFGLIITVLAAMVWRLSDGAGGYGPDVTAATLVAVYVPFLAGFAALLASPPDGDKRVLVTLALIVLSDTGGYVAGVLFGRHPMAPRVSPKKSWEGLGGSFVAAAVGGAILLSSLFHVGVFSGALFGLAIAAAATLGDLGESMIKRDLGVKDMSNLLPGHGGLMDRLDSILVAAPTAYVLLVLLVPPL